MTLRRLFVTGGSGFIGHEIVRLAEASGMTVRNADIRPPRDADQRVLWCDVDVRDAVALQLVLQDFQPDCVIHLASETDVSVRGLDGFTTTIDGTRNVIAAIRHLGSVRSFVHTSTQFVVRPGVAPPADDYYEPYTVYGAAKAESERLVRSSGLPFAWCIVRPTIIWGPHHPTFADNIWKFIRLGLYLHPSQSPEIMRAFGYVTNAAQQILSVALHGGAGRVYYVGDATIPYTDWVDGFSVALRGRSAFRVPVSLLKMLGTIGDAVETLGVRAPLNSGRVFRMTTSSMVNLTPTLEVAGEPTISLDEGVERTVDWLHSQRLDRR